MVRKFGAVLALAGALTLLAGTASSFAASNADNAKACQHDGWMSLVRSDHVTTFTNQGDCVSYAARGGTLTTPLPDLVVPPGGLSCSPGLFNQFVVCHVSLQNVGVARAVGTIDVTVTVDTVPDSGTKTCTTSVDLSLAPQGEQPSPLACRSNFVSSVTGYTATATLDTTNAIPEADETNNTATTSVTFRS